MKRVGGISLTFCSNVSGLCLLFPIHPKASSSSRLVLEHWDVRTRGMHIYLVSWVRWICYQYISFFWWSCIQRQKYDTGVASFVCVGPCYVVRCVWAATRSGYDMNLGFLAHSCSIEVDWNHSASSWNHLDFDTGLVRCTETSVELVRKRQNNGAVLADSKLKKVPAIFVEGDSTFLLAKKSKVRQLSAAEILPILMNLWEHLLRNWWVLTCSLVTWMVKLIGTWLIHWSSQLKKLCQYPWWLRLSLWGVPRG